MPELLPPGLHRRSPRDSRGLARDDVEQPTPDCHDALRLLVRQAGSGSTVPVAGALAESDGRPHVEGRARPRLARPRA